MCIYGPLLKPPSCLETVLSSSISSVWCPSTGHQNCHY